MEIQERMNYDAAIASAIGLARALRRHRRRMMAKALLASAAERANMARMVTELGTRENALDRFLADPYRRDALLAITHAEDRELLITAGRRGSAAAIGQPGAPAKVHDRSG